MSPMTSVQKAAVLKLAKSPNYSAKLKQVTGDALCRRGYSFAPYGGLYMITQAGLHFATTGEQKQED